MEAWNQLVVFPEFRRELQNEMATGVCKSSLDNCQMSENERKYDLDKLITRGIGTWNPLEWFKRQVKENGTYLAAGGIIGWILQVLVYLIKVALAYATMGWVGTIAVSRTLFCHATTTRQRIEAKSQRKQQRQVIEEGIPEDIPLTQPRWTFNTRMHQEEEV